MDKLLLQLSACSNLLEGADTGNLTWLDEFCAEFHKFASDFQLYLPLIAPKDQLEGNIKIQVGAMDIGFTQISTCVTQMERTIKEELKHFGTHLLVSRTHFSDRINWCIKRLYHCLCQITQQAIERSDVKLEELTFMELLDQSINKLESFKEIVAEQTVDEPRDANKQLSDEVNQMINQALAFSNVALKSDKKTINSICETVLNECTIFNMDFGEHNPGERQLKALSLQRALYSLQAILNEALLRLIFSTFHAMEQVSVTRLKNTIQDSEDFKNLICDFDVNMDRIQQIGLIAMAFTRDAKIKTIVHSCLTSLVSLNFCMVQAFREQTSNAALLHADILELHCNEELGVFRNNIHEIIDSGAFICCYLDMLHQSIPNAETLQANGLLSNTVQMGNVLCQHFQLRLNYQRLNEDGQRFHEDFVKMLRECQAMLQESSPADRKRITKSLNILYSVLVKLRNSFDPFTISGIYCPDTDSLTELKDTSLRRSFRKTKKKLCCCQ